MHYDAQADDTHHDATEAEYNDPVGLSPDDVASLEVALKQLPWAWQLELHPGIYGDPADFGKSAGTVMMMAFVRPDRSASSPPPWLPYFAVERYISGYQVTAYDPLYAYQAQDEGPYRENVIATACESVNDAAQQLIDWIADDLTAWGLMFTPTAQIHPEHRAA